MIGPVGASQRVTGASGRRPADASARAASAPAGEAASSARALVPVEPVARGEGNRARRWRSGANAAFLAQLMANKADMPHTRVRRREEPAAAVAAYRQSAERPRVPDKGVACSIAV